MKWSRTRSRQKGLVMVEFSIIGLLFFVLLFSVFEISRLLFVWNAVADAARLGARAASVCVIDSNDIANIALSNPNNAGNAFLPGDLDASNIQVRYLNENGGLVANPDPTNEATFMQIRYVEVSIVNYTHNLLIPVLGGPITLPPFTTTRPREALGIIPLPAGQVPSAANQGC